MRPESRQSAGGEEHSHDGADSCDAESNRHSANDPFAVRSDLACTRVQICLRQEEQEETVKEKNADDFKCATNWVPNQQKSGQADGQTEKHGDASHPAMRRKMTISKFPGKLKWHQNDENDGGHDMKEGQSSFGDKFLVKIDKLRWAFAGGSGDRSDPS